MNSGFIITLSALILAIAGFITTNIYHNLRRLEKEIDNLKQMVGATTTPSNNDHFVINRLVQNSSSTIHSIITHLEIFSLIIRNILPHLKINKDYIDSIISDISILKFQMYKGKYTSLLYSEQYTDRDIALNALSEKFGDEETLEELNLLIQNEPDGYKQRSLIDATNRLLQRLRNY